MEPIFLSSRVTVLYKLIVPIFVGFVTLLVWILVIALIGEKDAEGMLVVGLLFTFFLLLVLPFVFIQKVAYDADNLYVNNFRKTKEISLDRVKKVRRWMFYFYKIDYLDEMGQQKNVMFLPHLIERFEAMMGMPESLEIFEKKVLKPATATKN